MLYHDSLPAALFNLFNNAAPSPSLRVLLHQAIGGEEDEDAALGDLPTDLHEGVSDVLNHVLAVSAGIAEVQLRVVLDTPRDDEGEDLGRLDYMLAGQFVREGDPEIVV